MLTWVVCIWQDLSEEDLAFKKKQQEEAKRLKEMQAKLKGKKK